MQGRLFLLLLLFILHVINSCAKPKATVFKDYSLRQEEQVKICLIGDLGQGTEFQETIANALNKEKCHRIVMLGDLVYPSGISSTSDTLLEEKFLKYYDPLFEENPDLVYLLMLGNHDHQGEPSAWKSLYKKDSRYFFPNYYYFVDYGGLCLVALDTSFYFYKEKLAEAAEQTQWLNELQPRLKDCDVKVAVSHHPFKGGNYDGSADWKGAEGSLKVFLDSYVIGTFDLHIAGHVHILEDDGKDEGTHMLISGTGGENRGTGRSGFVVLTWDPSNSKRVGYHLKYVDTQVNVFNDTLTPQEEAERHPSEIINKTKLETGIFERLWNWLVSK